MRHLRMVRSVLGHSGAWRLTAWTAAAALLVAAGVVAADVPASSSAPAETVKAPAAATETPVAPPAGDTPVAPSKPEPEVPKPPVGDGTDTVKQVNTGVFDIHARDTDLRAVLTLLSNQGRRNIIATKEVSGKVSADLYAVTFKEALDAILRTTGFKCEEKGNFVYVYTADQYDKLRKDERKLETRWFRLRYLNANDAKVLIAPVLSSDASVAVTPAAAVGIAPSKADTGGNSLAFDDVLVVRDDREHLQRLEDLFKELDVKPEQVLIEATVLRASLTENNQLGIDIQALAGVDFEALGTVDAAKTADLSNRAQAARFGTDFAGGVDAGGLSIGWFTDNVAVFVRALESVTPTTVLANPKLLIVNKQRGEVLVGNRDGYITTTFTETTATQTVQFLETGTRLIVRPFIGRDGNIRLEIHPEDSSGSVSQVGNSALPSQTTTEVTTNVLVRDGHTIVIGGLFRERTTAGRAQVPIAGNLPIVGPLFRRTSDATSREEVIILITPRIIKQSVDEAIGDQLKEDVERFRVGQRKGLMWWGRDRLAQTHMRWARKNLADGKTCQALWDVDLALSMSPQMADAIELKETLTGKAIWSDEARTSNARWIIERMMMQEMGLPYETVVPPQRPLEIKELPADVREAFGMKARIRQPLLVMPDPISREALECESPKPPSTQSAPAVE